MPRKKKNALPSGSVRIQRRYTDEQGATHRKSFTGATRAEAEALAAEWEQRGRISQRLTVGTAVDRYIRMKEAVLSPSTIRGYKTTLNHHLTDTIRNTELAEVSNTDLQLWISDMTLEGLSPKTVGNAYGLVSAALQMFMPNFHPRVTLPKKQRPELYCPSAEEVRAVVEATEDPETRAAILLAAVGTMRRGEICGLSWSDIHGNTVRIRHSLVKDSTGAWILKAPKTASSNRDVVMTDEVIKAVQAIPRTGDRIFSVSPDGLGQRFDTAVARAGVHEFRFHDLRHFSASQMHLMGIPDKYIEARGGWRPGSTVMKTVYQDVISLEKKKQDKRILEIFSAM